MIQVAAFIYKNLNKLIVNRNFGYLVSSLYGASILTIKRLPLVCYSDVSIKLFLRPILCSEAQQSWYFLWKRSPQNLLQVEVVLIEQGA